LILVQLFFVKVRAQRLGKILLEVWLRTGMKALSEGGVVSMFAGCKAETTTGIFGLWQTFYLGHGRNWRSIYDD
jgi:hypothetical protein